VHAQTVLHERLQTREPLATLHTFEMHRLLMSDHRA